MNIFLSLRWLEISPVANLISRAFHNFECEYKIRAGFHILKNFLLPDWTATGLRNTSIDFDLESTPLQIQTDSIAKSGDVVWVWFHGSTYDGAGIFIYFNELLTYTIGWCKKDKNVTFTLPGKEKYRIWTFMKQDNTLQLLCNGVEIFNFNYAEPFSNNDECKTRWSQALTKMRFPSDSYVSDTASDYFRPYIRCTYKVFSLFVILVYTVFIRCMVKQNLWP